MIAAVAALLCMGVVVFYIGLSKTKDTSPMTIAVLDGERLKKDATPFMTVHQLMSAEFDKVKSEFGPFSAQLETAFDLVRSEKNPAKAQKKKEAFDKKRVEIEQVFIKKQEYLHSIEVELTNKLQNTVFEIVDELAKKHNISIILNRMVDDKISVFYSKPHLDITDEVIREVNRRLKNVQLPKETKK
jgi:Skp family chaperone for outer membrane proteins